MRITPIARPSRIRFSLTLARARALLLAACLALALVAAPTPARAQEDAMAMIFLNPVGRDSMQRAKKILALDAEQVTMANDLYSGYRAGIKTAMQGSKERQREAMEKAEASGDYANVRKGMQEAMKKTIDEVDALTKTFMDDFKAVLTTSQAEKFGAFERSRRRESGKYIQLLAGEGLDLVALMDEQNIAWRDKPEVASVVERYELDLDRSLVEREKLFREAMQKLFTGDGEEAAARELVPKLMQQGKVSRDVNRNAVRTIGALLSPEERAKLEEQARVRSFPMIFRNRAVSQSVEAAKKIDGLGDSQKKELDEVLKNYEREALAINTAWMSAIDNAQEKSLGDAEKIMRGDDELDRPAEQAQEQRTELDKRYRERIEKLLNDEQRKSLPAFKPQRRASRGGIEPDPDRQALKEWGDGEDDDHDHDH